MAISLTKKLFYIAALIIGIAAAVVITQAQTPNASITLVKDSNNLFTVTISDPNGIAEFSLEPPNRFSYGGGLKGCPTNFKITNTAFADPDDFTPKMIARVIDCQNGITEFDILPPVDGKTRGAITNTPPPPKPAAKAAPTEEPAEEKATKIEEPKTLPDTIKYPVPELGNCANETECKLYCDDAAHNEECLAFAKKHTLLPPDEMAKAEKFLDLGGKGPGGCNSQKSCETYCGNVDHIDECIDFAEKGNFLSGKELAEAKKFQTLLKAGEKFPGGCKDRNTCEVYCNSPDNMEECIAFAEKSGFLDEKELAEAKKFIPLMKSGETPGGCRSKEQCETYCDSEENLEQCFAFAEKHGLVTPEEAEIFRKSGGKGPGNCRGRDQCEAYCQENQEECFNWAQENGLMKEEDLEQMRQGMQQFREQFDKMPPEVTQCLKDVVGEENLNKMLAGQPVFARDMESKMRGCFEKLAQSFGGGFPGGPGGPGGFSGPGGCTGPEECQAYCTANPEACQGFAPPGGGMPGGPGGPGGGGFSGPGGCTSVEECTNYCLNDPEACKNFAPPGGGGGPPGGFPGGPPGGFPGGPGGFPGSPGGFPDGQGGFPGGIPSGESFVGPGGCATPEECIRYCSAPGRGAECDQFKTPATTPYAPGRGPGSCGSVEECNAYCKANPSECEGFISEKVPSEEKCQPGFEIRRDNKGNKYCNPVSCPEGQKFITDVYGRQACSPMGSGQQQQYQDQAPSNFQPPTNNFPAPPTISNIQGLQLPQDICANFTTVQSCSYVGPVGSENYNYCKQCYPDK